VPPAQVEALLARLAGLTNAPGHAIDVYERQIGRCKAPTDRLAALARAAQMAATRGALDRARGFYEIALGSGVNDEAIGALVQSARAADSEAGRASGSLRALLAQTLAAGGHGSRDGGRTRSALLRRAASLAFDDLGDAQQAFAWLADALVAHVDDASLDVLAELGARVGDPRRVEASLSKALEEVFDGPLVRKLLQRRARLRRDALGDERGAATDLKKLRELAPNDADVTQELTSLLDALQDHRGMIQLLEDQILRGRDPAARAELARKVAHLWEQELGDAREAGDAWRRVLRMKPNDPDATAGLERAKSGQLRRADPRPPRAEKPVVLPAVSPEPALFAAVSSEPAAAEGTSTPAQAPADVDGPTADGTTDALSVAEPASATEPASLDASGQPEPSAAAPSTDEGAWGQALPGSQAAAATEQPYAVEGSAVEGSAAQGYAAQGYAQPAPEAYAAQGYAQPAPEAYSAQGYTQPAPEAYAAHEGLAYPAQGHPNEPQQAPYGAEASHDAPPDLQPQPVPYPEFPPHLQPQWDAATQQYVYPPGYAEAYALYYEQLAAYQAQYGHVAPAEPAAESGASEAAPESVDEADLVEDAEILDDDDQS
jgi:hypothetical protein